MRTGILATVAAAAIGLALLSPSSAEEPLDGQKIYRSKTCVACHGAKGQKPVLTYPVIAGQNEKYALTQMKDIKSGKRVSSIDPSTKAPFTKGMADIMHLVSDDELKALAKWISTQEPAPPKPLDPPASAEQLDAGAAAYKKLGCVACHGKLANKATSPAYPDLAGQRRDYLLRQMTDIRDGVRTNGQTKLMLPTIKKADDAAIAAMADYLSQLDPKAK